jgi:hypothetical protein
MLTGTSASTGKYFFPHKVVDFVSTNNTKNNTDLLKWTGKGVLQHIVRHGCNSYAGTPSPCVDRGMQPLHFQSMHTKHYRYRELTNILNRSSILHGILLCALSFGPSIVLLAQPNSKGGR